MPLEIKIEETYLFKKGELKGELKGEKKGLKKGELKIKIKTVKALIKIGKLSKEEIAFAAGVALAFVEDIISKDIHK
jgi:DNA invertase Pin-like site-specific DNA recombinase